MPFLIAGAGWSLLATLAGFITGTPELRSFGLIGFLIFVGVAVLWDRYAQVTHGPIPLREVNAFDWGDVELDDFPDFRDNDREAA